MDTTDGSLDPSLTWSPCKDTGDERLLTNYLIRVDNMTPNSSSQRRGPSARYAMGSGRRVGFTSYFPGAD
jgi:hypothetical protein